MQASIGDITHKQKVLFHPFNFFTYDKCSDILDHFVFSFLANWRSFFKNRSHQNIIWRRKQTLNHIIVVKGCFSVRILQKVSIYFGRLKEILVFSTTIRRITLKRFANFSHLSFLFYPYLILGMPKYNYDLWSVWLIVFCVLITIIHFVVHRCMFVW